MNVVFYVTRKVKVEYTPTKMDVSKSRHLEINLKLIPFYLLTSLDNFLKFDRSRGIVNKILWIASCGQALISGTPSGKSV